MRLISFLAVGFLLSTAAAQTVTSPDGQLVATFQTVTRTVASPGQPPAGLQPAPQGQLVYRVTFHGQELLEPSALRLELKDQPVLGAAVRIANSIDYGLSASVWSANMDNCLRIGRKVRAGTVWMNTYMDGAAELPFGGYRQSGLGRELGRHAVEDYTESKTLNMHIGPRAAWWMPR